MTSGSQTGVAARTAEGKGRIEAGEMTESQRRWS